jgi:hypothetical protein
MESLYDGGEERGLDDRGLLYLIDRLRGLHILERE